MTVANTGNEEVAGEEEEDEAESPGLDQYLDNLMADKLASQRDPLAYTMQRVKAGWTDLIVSCPVVTQSLDMSFGSVTPASSVGGGTSY